MNFRAIAQVVCRCVASPVARAQIYRVLVHELAEPGALKAVENIDRILDREIDQFQQDCWPASRSAFRPGIASFGDPTAEISA